MSLLGKLVLRPLKSKLEVLILDFVKEEILLCMLIFFLVCTIIRQKSRVVASFIEPQCFPVLKYEIKRSPVFLNMNREMRGRKKISLHFTQYN